MLYFLIILSTLQIDICHVFKDKSFWLSSHREKMVCKWTPTVIKQANKNNLDPILLMALITIESGWNKKAVSKANACGLTQVIPKYTGTVTRKYTCEQLKNPRISIAAGAKILRWWIDWHNGNISRALCGYSSGFRCGKKKGTKPLKAGMRYSKKVLDQEQKIKRLYNNMRSLD